MAAAATARPAPTPAPAPSSPASQCLNFTNIRYNGSGDIGLFRAMNEKFGWRVRKSLIGGEAASKKTVQYDGSTVSSASWIKVAARDYQLKIVFSTGEVARFDGFRDQDFASLQSHAKQHWHVDLAKGKVASRGWNWGEGRVEDDLFEFVVDGDVAFDLQSKSVGQVSASRGDVTLVLAPDQERAEIEDQLLEIRLFIPPSKPGEEEAVETLKDSFLAFAGSRSTSLQSLCTITDVKVLVPAGRFDLVITRRLLKLQGKSNDFTIDYSNITRMFLLHSALSPHMNLVMSLESPLRKGRTSYQNVVIQFDDKKMVDVELGLSEEEISSIESKNSFKTNLEPRINGTVHDVVARVLKALSGKQIVVPEDFRSATGQACFRSSYKADSGNFYPLNKTLIFIPKPVIILNNDDITSVSFGRTSGAQTKLFEFDVNVKQGQTYSFSSVDRQESAPFIEFLQNRGIRIRSVAGSQANEGEGQSILSGDLPSEESDDEDYEAGSSESDESLVDDEEEDEEDTEERDKKESKKRKHSSSKHKKQKESKNST